LHKRFGSDLEHYHHILWTANSVSYCLVTSLLTIIITLSTVPKILLVLVFVGYKSYKVYMRIKTAQTEVWKLSDEVNTPFHKHLQETRTGNTLIRAFKKVDCFETKMMDLLETKLVYDLIDKSLWNFFCFRMNCLNDLVASSGFFLCVMARGHISPVTLILAMMYVGGLSGNIMWVL
jgi:ABC-type multidrug transport system fused ATPase/permease subunit